MELIPDKFVRNKIFYAIIVLAFLSRLAVAFYGYKNEVWGEFGDDLARERYAKTILKEGLVFHMENYRGAESIFAPGVPIIMAISKGIFGGGWLPLFIINSLVGTITCIIIFFIATSYFNKSIALLALFWAALYPNFLRYTSTAGNEPWIVFLFALMFLFLIRSIKSDRIDLNVFGYAFFYTLLFHFDERYITYSVILFLLLFLGSTSVIVKAKKAFFFAFLTMMFSVPWLIRNYIVYNDIVLISCRTTSITNPILHHRKELLFFDHVPDNRFLKPSQIDSVQKGLLNTYKDGKQILPEQISAMKKGNIPHPFTFKEQLFSRSYFLWMPFKFRDNYRIDGFNFKQAWSVKHNIISILCYGVLLPFTLFSLVLLWKGKKWSELILFSSILFYHTIVHIIFIPYTRDRYRHPIDFIIIILGVYGIYIIYEFFFKLRLHNNNVK